MILTGLGFAAFGDFWPLLVVAFIGTLNPSAGDVSVFLPLEQAMLARSVSAPDRTALFARYSLVGSLLGAGGTLLAALPSWPPGAASRRLPRSRECSSSTRSPVWSPAWSTVGCPRPTPRCVDDPSSALGPSRRIVYRLAALFSLDAFAGGFVVQSLLALWLLEAFGLSLVVTAQLFFWSGLLTSLSYLAAVPLARRIGLINTMVFTHLPANLCLIAVPFVAELWQVVALLLARSLLSQMDVPTRTSYVMAVVTPAERQAAASLTAVPRSLAAAVSPSLAGWMLASAELRLAAAARRSPEDRLRPHAPRPVPPCAPS